MRKCYILHSPTWGMPFNIELLMANLTQVTSLPNRHIQKLLKLIKLQSVLNPHLGQAGAPYAKTVPSKTPVLGALPDPGDIFDRRVLHRIKFNQLLTWI